MPYLSPDTPAQTGPPVTTPVFRIHMEKSLIFLPVTSLFQSCFLSAATTATGAPDCTGNAAGMPRELHGLYTGVSRERCKLCNTPPLPATNSAPRSQIRTCRMPSPDAAPKQAGPTDPTNRNNANNANNFSYEKTRSRYNLVRMPRPAGKICHRCQIVTSRLLQPSVRPSALPCLLYSYLQLFPALQLGGTT